MVNDFYQLNKEWIRQSNLIEDIDDPVEDDRSFEAWKKLTEEFFLSVPSISYCHWNIMLALNSRIAGDFRKCNVYVADRICPDWKQIPNLLQKWLAKYGLANTTNDVIKAHIEFEKIHPFEDGNGRIGRMIMNYQLFKANKGFICIHSNERKEYYKWFL